MESELLFSLVGILSMLGWLSLLLSPVRPTWSDRIAGIAVPALLALVYVAVLAVSPTSEGGFGTFAEVVTLFADPGAVMAGWIHFLAFDLVVGAWICRTARAESIGFGWVVPCLPVTFLLGPLGYLLFLAVWGGHRVVRARAE